MIVVHTLELEEMSGYIEDYFNRDQNSFNIMKYKEPDGQTSAAW